MIVVLVALVVIFLITLGIGGCHGSGPPDPDKPGAVGGLKGLQGNRFLEIGDKASTTCDQLDAVTLRVTGTCAITLQKRAFFRRSTRIAFTVNAPTRVIINPKDGPRQDVQLPKDGKFCFGSAVGRSGGTITLASTNATLVLRRQGCPE
jgi:hypothetical protein